MESNRDNTVDMGNLTEREMLILLLEKMSRIETDFAKNDSEVEKLKSRVTVLETRLYTVSAMAIFISTVFGLIINFYRTFK